MSKIVADFRNLLSTTVPPQRGSVMATGANYVTVVTPNGLRDFKTPMGAFYNVGEEVLMQGEVLIGKVAPELGIPSYTV